MVQRGVSTFFVASCFALGASAPPLDAQQCAEQVLGGVVATYFGGTLATDGETLLVRRRVFDWASAHSRVDHFERVGGQWVRRGTLEPTGSGFGSALAVDGDQLSVGAWGPPLAVHLYARDQGGWTPTALLTPGDASSGQGFGSSLALDGDWLGVGAQQALSPAGVATGRVHLYQRSGGNTWSEALVLHPDGGAAGDRFGASVALAGDLLAVGSPYHDQPAADAGAVYVYERALGAWQFVQKIEGPAGGALFGSNLALHGDRLAAAAPGQRRVTVWRREAGGFTLEAELHSPETFQHLDFAARVALEGDRLIVGAPSTSSSLSGAAYLFDRSGTRWTFAGKLQSVSAGSGHGSQLALGGDNLFVGWGSAPPAAAARLFAYDLGAPWSGWADLPFVGVDLGGVQRLRLATCPPMVGGYFWLLGSAGGTRPGLPLPPERTLSLVPDAYFWLTASQPSPPPIQGGVGPLGADGIAAPAIAIPAGTPPALAGVELHHALVGFSPQGTLSGVSPPVSLELRERKSIWRVGADPDADFADLQAAIAAPQVQDGDTLLVSPGPYPGFVLDKALSVLGVSGSPSRVGPVEVRDVPHFTLADLSASSLAVRNVWGRGVIDAMEVWSMAAPGVYDSSTIFEDVGELVVSRSHFAGGDTCVPAFGLWRTPGVELRRSKAVFVDCTFWGGWVLNDPDLCKFVAPDYTAGAGIEVWEGSQITLAGCRVWGGLGQGFPDTHGDGLAVAGSNARVVGGAQHVFEVASSALAITADPNSSVRASGVTLSPFAFSPGVAWLPDPEPYLRVTGPKVPGGTWEVHVHGPAGAWFWVAASPEPAYLPGYFSGLDPLWIAPAAAVSVQLVQTAGHGQPVSAALPPLVGAPGAPLWVQAWMRSGPFGGGSVTNVAQALRYGSW